MHRMSGMSSYNANKYKCRCEIKINTTLAHTPVNTLAPPEGSNRTLWQTGVKDTGKHHRARLQHQGEGLKVCAWVCIVKIQQYLCLLFSMDKYSYSIAFLTAF